MDGLWVTDVLPLALTTIGALWQTLPWLLTMVVLIGCSAFFSASEAALFSLRGPDRRLMATGNSAERVAEELLQNPDRLLSAVLFWNLVVNILYFAIASMVSARWEADPSLSVAFAIGSLLLIIFFSEMLPKSLAVVSPRRIASAISLPLAAAVSLVDPIMPWLRTVNLLSRRLIWPGLEEQPYLEIKDLERAIKVSTAGRELVGQEHIVLHNIVQLSDLRVQEWMRPRNQFLVHSSPVSIDVLGGVDTPSGYLLIAGPDGDEIAAAISLNDLTDVQPDHLDRQARPVAYIPWCSTVSEALQQLRVENAEVAAVVNEHGETIGIVTIDDIFAAVLTEDPTRGERLLNKVTIEEFDEETWAVLGMTNLRSLAQHFELELPESHHVTLGGIAQEVLERLPEVGDEFNWGPFNVMIIDDSESGRELRMLVRLDGANGESP